MKTLSVDGHQFRDLDHDGVLSPYEDHRLPAETRAQDLIGRMTLREKAGLVMHGSARTHGELGVLGVGDEYDLDANRQLIGESCVSHLITRLDAAPAEFARQNNALQTIAADTRLGIPLTISTDPRHHFQHTTGVSEQGAGFSKWPEPTGLAAIGSAELVERFAQIAAEEYRAVGIHLALSPQADIATEPRWSRISGTFGEDPQLARQLVKAYVRGMQGDTLNPSSVACVVKHWVGYPAAPEGFDGHNAYGRFSAVTEASLPLHIEAFLGAFEVGVAGVMPTYTILRDLALNGVPLEQVAGGFSEELVNGLLRQGQGFEGFVLSDWLIHSDASEETFHPTTMQSPAALATCWGVESLSRSERFAKSINAGMDQFGGEEDVDTLVRVVEQGLVTEERIDLAAERLLLPKFRQGLFEDPFVDEQRAAELVGDAANVQAGRDAQRRSIVCLKKPASVKPGTNARLVDLSAGEAPNSGSEVAVVRLTTPSQQLHPHFFFGSRMAEGDIDFKSDAPVVRQLQALAATRPVIGVIRMDRPAVLGPLLDMLDGIYVDLGVSDEVLLQAINVAADAEGRLPFELPSSMAAVRAQRPDLPCDSSDPLFPIHSNWAGPAGGNLP